MRDLIKNQKLRVCPIFVTTAKVVQYTSVQQTHRQSYISHYRTIYVK